MTGIENHTGDFLPQLPFFKGLPEADISALMAAASLHNYTKHQNLFQQGDQADRFFVVISGWIKLYRHTAEGDEAVVAIFTRGDVFGEAAIISGAGYPFAAQAAEETRLIEIPGTILRERARENHEVMARIMTSMSRELRSLQMENEHLSLMSAPQRVGCLLLQLSSGMIGKGGTFSFPYDKSLAAARLGMKPETFSRALTQLKPIGVSVNGPEIKIDSFSGLVNYCCNSCSSLPGECQGSRTTACETTGCSGCSDKKVKVDAN